MTGLQKWAVVLCVSMGPMMNQAEEPVKPAPPVLEVQLEDVRTKLAEAHKDLAVQVKELWKKQHDLEYKNEECVELRGQIVKLEKELIAKRQQLDERLEQIPEIKDLNSRRKQLFLRIEELKQTEQLILNEMKGAGLAPQESDPIPGD